MVKVCFFPFRIKKCALNFFNFCLSVFLAITSFSSKAAKIFATPIKRGPFFLKHGLLSPIVFGYNLKRDILAFNSQLWSCYWQKSAEWRPSRGPFDICTNWQGRYLYCSTMRSVLQGQTVLHLYYKFGSQTAQLIENQIFLQCQSQRESNQPLWNQLL